MKKKILILYTAVGYGHKAIGENFATVLRADGHEVDTQDILELAGGKLGENSSKTYLFILEHLPWLWEFFYTNKLFIKLTLPFRTKVAHFKALKVANFLINKHYDVIICTQATASSIVSYLKQNKMFNGKFVVTFSDPHLHPYWLFDNVDLYLANIVEQKEEMISMGIPAEKIYVCGVTILPPKTFDKNALREKYGLREGEKLVVILGGARGYGFDQSTIENIAKADTQIFIICGLNEQLRNNMEKFYGGSSRIKIFGFVDFLAELFSIANVVVTKPGALTLCECLSYRVPILVPGFIPGGERMNVEYLTERNLILPEFVDLAGAIEDELETGMFAEKLKNNEEEINKLVQYGETVKQAIDSL